MQMKKKVLICVDWFDPAFKAGGPVISTIKLIENLYEDYDFYVLTGSVDYGDEQPLPVERDCWVDWQGKAKVYYMSKENQRRREIFRIMDEVEADINYVQGIFSFSFSIYPLIWWHQAKKERIIVAPRGMFHSTALNVKRTKKILYITAAKIMGWFNHVLFHTTNPEETTEVKKILGKKVAFHEASNFPHILPYVKGDYDKQKGVVKILSIARISPEKNTLFLISALSKMKCKAEVTLIGTYADESYFNAVMKKIASLPENVVVKYEGHKKVSELEAYYKLNDIFVLPTRGENFGHAIVEALFSGLPCIISDNTPWHKLEEEGAGCNLNMDENKYAAVMDSYCSMDAAEYSLSSQNARKYMEQRIDIESIKNCYKKLLS